eukprot:TRINITY_DN4622_c0_g1_i2.p1 TRINITY_DN4622_c0_g1~~TRINITY_DN4622_c0_g1_i2.p1  ORF type:complete len:192 (-),score=19.72 TRINITY_DN4622_c0_g1_i2:31-606(-)
MMLKKGLEDIIEYILEHISSTTMLFYASSLIEIICNNDIQYNRGVVNRIVARGTIIKLMRGLSISTIKAKKADTIFAALCIIINMSYEARKQAIQAGIFELISTLHSRLLIRDDVVKYILPVLVQNIPLAVKSYAQDGMWIGLAILESLPLNGFVTPLASISSSCELARTVAQHYPEKMPLLLQLRRVRIM